jgi:poly(A) polymerase
LPARNDLLELIRATLAGRHAWLVGGAVRDRLLQAGVDGGHQTRPPRAARKPGGLALGGRALETTDLDVVLDGDPGEVARAIAGAARRSAIGKATAFALSEEYGGWRVLARDGSWQVDVERLRGATLEEDLALRDFTVNAIAEPLGEPDAGPGGAIDPLGGIEDLGHRRLRAAGQGAFAQDPLRVLRLVRFAVELGFEPDTPTRALARAHAEGLRTVAGERVFMELRRILDAPRAVHGLELMGEVGATPVVLPELDALRGVEQSRFHHLDVYGHTLAVLTQTIALQEDPVAVLEQGRGVGSGPEHAAALGPEDGDALVALLAEPLADGLTRGGALRWAALLHDAAKPLTRGVLADPRSFAGERVTFIDHDVVGAQVADEVFGRLRASRRLQAQVAALVRHHLRLGFLVHEPQPLPRRSVFAYLRACEPVEVDVTLLSVADRLGTRGDRAEESIDAHLRLARAVLTDAIGWHTAGPPQPLLRGDELAGALGIPAGPRLGELLEELLEAQYAGEISTREDALAYAHARAG